ncbi:MULTISPECIES: NAD(P)H-hydrate epimerase [unclassified Adlercreutzia]|uniref:NAD(P)H-hydrate epimerase n=1 Tax=unclassified Adlercreutzia TaxID=2636013 RepID=UPI0013EB5AFE|nr:MULTISPECIES: NAD(P)H-hydrate epimerase [unclassified Adlercreutzia]
MVIPWDDAAELPVLDVGQVVALEQRIAAEGTSLYELMKRAGAAVVEVVCAETDAVEAASEPSSVVVLAGSGNNGGDGWVAASLLANRGVNVTLVTKTPADQVRAEPAGTAAHDACADADADVPGFAIIVNPDTAQLDALLSRADIAVDAILGTGFAHRAVREPYATWINTANRARRDTGMRMVAVDVPSGLDAQTGEQADSCVQADVTVTMLAAKPGLLMANGKAQTGRLFLAPLGCDV